MRKVSKILMIVVLTIVILMLAVGCLIDENQIEDYEQVTSFYNPKANIHLAGTLALPEGGDSAPAVILITGSGAQDRDETVYGHKPFKVISDYLVNQGIVVLRFDDRGVGQSEGNFETATTYDFADDVASAVAYLKTLPEVDDDKIGLIGHSEGGMVAQLVSSQSEDISFLVLLASPGVSGREIITSQVEKMYDQSSLSDQLINRVIESQEEVLDLIQEIDDKESLSKAIANHLQEVYGDLSKDDQNAVGYTKEVVDMRLEQLTSGWYRTFINFEPDIYLSQIRVPVLAINGKKDVQVIHDINLSAIEEALMKAGNKSFDIVAIDDLNHLFQKAKTGMPEEYASIKESFNQDVLELMSKWIIEQVE